ncbi:hypothetical protein DFJ73DRAFT_768673 [Zopfochytrium polystomum]|nr:hypothetical protein DFJ73DRAFT_768673 [Zopfochytrium polystomum]
MRFDGSSRVVHPTGSAADPNLNRPIIFFPQADCSKKKFRSELSLYRRAIEYLFEDDDAWDESDLNEDGAVMDVDYAVEDALKKSPLSSQNPLRPYQKKTLERTNTTPKPYKGAPAKAAGASTTPVKAATPAKAAAASEKAGPGAAASAAPAKKSWNPFNKKTNAAASTAATDASGAAAAKKSSSWNPFKKKEPNPDEIKHVKVGGGLINKFRVAEKMRTSAEKKIDAQVKAGGCAVVHNKINGQHGL